MKLRSHYVSAPRRASGFSLIELMVALVLGLILTMGALSIFLSARAAFRTTEDLSRVQEAGRIAFELMARDVREAGGNQCASSIRLGNVAAERDNDFWKNWPNGLVGFGGASAFSAPAFGFSSGVAGRVNGTDALEVHSTEDLGMYLTAPMTARNSDLQVNAVPADVRANDVLMICDYRLVTLFKATGVSANAVAHGTGGGGNCSVGFSRELALLCKDDSAVPASSWHLYGTNSVVSRPHAVRWYIGNNAEGGRSLYRAVVDSKGTQAAPDEVAEGVSQMNLVYLMAGQTNYQAAAAITDWAKVKAARVVLTLESHRKSGVDNAPISRTVTAVLAMRNRNL